MATKKPRIQVTLDPEDYELVRKVAKANGSSMGALLAEYVEMSRPVLRDLAVLADAIEQAQEERREVHREAVDRAAAKGGAMMDLLAGQFPLFGDFVESLAEELLGREVTVAEFAGHQAQPGDGEQDTEDPRTCNTGVRLQQMSTEEGK